MFESTVAHPYLTQGHRLGSRATGRQMPDTLDWGITFAVWAACSTLLLGFQAYLQNTNIATTNGLWQSVELRHWMEGPGFVNFDFANALYYPVYGFLCRIIGGVGLLQGPLWSQMAELNAVFAGFGLAAVYLFVMAWLQRRSVALLTVALYGGSGFFLLLSVISEYDIVPYVFVLIATLMACAWFAQPRVREIAAVAVVFSIGWLFGWHFLFPSLPPLLLALLLAAGNVAQRLIRPVLFLLFMSIPPLVVTFVYFSTNSGHVAEAGTFLIRLFWVGKGVGTGWGGFSAAKIPLAVGGMAESLIGGRNLSYGAWSTTAVATEIAVGTIIELVLLGFVLRYAWRNRSAPSIVTAAVLLGGTLVTGIVFNLYSQPQDPEMVISVMIWTVPGWALGAQSALDAGGRTWHHWQHFLRPIVIMVVLAPVGYNVVALAAFRGADATNVGVVSELSGRFDPRRTVFLYQGFEGIITWQFALQDGSFAEPSGLPPAPSPGPTFKLISATRIPVNHPNWTPSQQASNLRDQINGALNRGYEVVAGGSFLAPEKVWVDSFRTVAPSSVPEEMRRIFDQNFQSAPAYSDPWIGRYSFVTRNTTP
jgi:hypothetical protein